MVTSVSGNHALPKASEVLSEDLEGYEKISAANLPRRLSGHPEPPRAQQRGELGPRSRHRYLSRDFKVLGTPLVSALASEIRRKRVDRMRALPHRHLDEGFVKINGGTHYLWRAVDHECAVLESLVTKTRDKKTALKFLTKTLKRRDGYK